jgi:hypothetical protein
MKMIHYSLIATYVALLATVDAPHKLMASDALSSKSTVPAIGLNEPLLAQAAAGGAQKAGDKAPKVIRNIRVHTEGQLIISRLRMTKRPSTKRPQSMPRSTAVFAPTP